MQVPSVPATAVPDDAYLLDVRNDDEWVAGHIADSVHLPMSQVVDRQGEIPRERAVVVVCKMGARSAQVADYLLGLGWPDVHNLDGGVQAWLATGRPLVTDAGAPGQVL